MSMPIRDRLFELQDSDYAAFQAKLTPGVPLERFIGVRVPDARRLAKTIASNPETAEFLTRLPHDYFDEDMLHALLISEIKDYETCIAAVDAFLPYVDNWAVCDVMSPKAFKKHKAELLGKIRVWASSKEAYTCRFGLEMLMTHFLDEDFEAELLEIPAAVRSEEYYVNMMIAWFFATALAKQWDAAIPYLQQSALDSWVHNKTIQKARESRRIVDKRKAYLKTLKR